MKHGDLYVLKYTQENWIFRHTWNPWFFGRQLVCCFLTGRLLVLCLKRCVKLEIFFFISHVVVVVMLFICACPQKKGRIAIIYKFPFILEYKNFLFDFYFIPGTEAIMARTLILHIMKDMLSHGYLICTGIDLSRNKSEKDVLLFRKVAPLDTNFFCLAPKKMSSLLFLNAPPEIIQVIFCFFSFLLIYWFLTLSKKYDWNIKRISGIINRYF